MQSSRNTVEEPMRLPILATAIAFGLAPLTADAGRAPLTGQEAPNLQGMTCVEQSNALDDFIEQEMQTQEERRLGWAIQGAKERCLEGDETALRELAARLENRNWVLDQEKPTVVK
jgi:hypothetical protein